MAVAKYDGMNDALTDGMTDGRVVKKANPDRGGVVERTTSRMRNDVLDYSFGAPEVAYRDPGAEKEEYYLARPDVPHSVPPQEKHLDVVPSV